MAPGYRLNKPKQENFDGEDIDRLFYGDHKITIFDNPDYEQARNGWQKLEPEHFSGSTNKKCNCKQYEKTIDFYHNVFLILLIAFVLRMILDGMRGILSKKE